jgi:hypothetical protein
MNEIQILGLTLSYTLVIGVYYGAKSIYFINKNK